MMFVGSVMPVFGTFGVNDFAHIGGGQGYQNSVDLAAGFLIKNAMSAAYAAF